LALLTIFLHLIFRKYFIYFYFIIIHILGFWGFGGWVVITDVPANSQVLPASVGSLREGANVRLISPAPGAPAATSAKP